MTHAIGTDLGGIRTLLDLRDRCRFDELSDCWIWSGAVTNGSPCMRLPGIGRTVGAGVAICFLVTGNEPEPGTVWHRTCRTKLCVCPDHRQIGDRKSQMAFSRGVPKPPGVRMRIALTKRATSTVTDEMVDDILSSNLTALELAAKHGISHTHVCRILRRETRRELGVSVFSGWAA